MRRWDRLVEEYVEGCRARGLAEGRLAPAARSLRTGGLPQRATPAATPASAPPRLQELAECVDGEPRVAHDPAHRVGVDRVGSWNSEDARPIGHHHVPALAKHAEAGLLECANGLLVRNARELGQRAQTATSISRTVAPWRSSSTAARYSWIASWMFLSASSSVSPCDQQPGRPGTETLNPSSDS